VRGLYDEQISQLEKKYPAVATDIDVRGTMSESEQELWYQLEKYYPKKDQPPSD
jgi:predicted RNA-binding protein